MFQSTLSPRAATLCVLLCMPLLAQTAGPLPLRSSLTTWHWDGLHLAMAGGSLTAFEGELSEGRLQVYAVAPVFYRPRLFVGMGIDYEAWRLDMDPEVTVHRLLAPLGLFRRFSERWAIYAESDLGIQAEADQMDADALNWIGYAYASWNAAPRLRFRMGGAYDLNLGEPAIYPLLGVHWLAGSRFALDVLLPVHAMLRFKVSPVLDVGLRSRIHSRSFLAKESTLRHLQVTLGPYADYTLVRQLALRVEVRALAWRRTEADGTDGGLLKENVMDAAEAEMSVRWSY